MILENNKVRLKTNGWENVREKQRERERERERQGCDA
jgi:hypothetical protein